MGRQSGMVIGSGSSIAILQERFKRLERVREKREEEFLQFFCGHDDKANISTCPTDIILFKQPKMQQQRLHQQVSPLVTEARDPLSLELDCWKRFKHDENTRQPWNMSSRSPAGNYNGSEVDTTLHL